MGGFARLDNPKSIEVESEEVNPDFALLILVEARQRIAWPDVQVKLPVTQMCDHLTGTATMPIGEAEMRQGTGSSGSHRLR